MLSDQEFRMVLDYFNRPWKGYRKVRKGIKKRIRRHMQAVGCSRVQEYLSILSNDENHRREAASCLLVTISRFFRDRRVWDCLGGTVLPELVTVSPERVRVWSAGCACGEEAYSLSILWHGSGLQRDTRLHILGTDVNPVCLERARMGRYGKSSLKAVDEPTLQRCFKKVPGSRQYEIRDCVKAPIRWQLHELFSPMCSGPFHIILLRNNLLTYHRGKELADGFGLILERILPGGYLVIGAHERIPTGGDTALEQMPDAPCIYRYVP